MNILFHNAKAYIDAGHFEEAVLVRGNRIVAVGSNEEMLRMARNAAGGDGNETDIDGDCEFFDCGGRTLLPGFNDSHMHLMEFGEGLRQAPIAEARSVEELIKVCQAFAKANPESVRNGLHAAGWNQDCFSDGRMPGRSDLDRISTEFPIILERVCGHILCANTKALEMLGLAAGSPQYDSGLFYGDACLAARKLIPEFTEAEKLDILEEAMQYAASRGVTSVQSNDVGAMSGTHEGNFELFRKLYAQGRGLIRYRHQVNFDSPEDFRECAENGEFAKATELYPEGSLLTLGPLKLYKDGSLGARTALMKNGYKGRPEERGLEWLDDEEMMQYLRIAAAHGIQAVTHCIGDAAVEKTADCYIRCNKEMLGTDRNPLRHALVHCQITNQATLDKIAEHGLLAMVQPVFLNADIKILDGLIEPEMATTSYAFRSLLRSGPERVSFGTDCPVEDCDPFRNIYCAVTRRALDGTPAGGFCPGQRVSLEAAIDAYTIGSAYAEFMEDKLGRIKPGYLADLTLLDRDIFDFAYEELLEVKLVMTMVNGLIIHQNT